MTAPIYRQLTREEATGELKDLESQVVGTFEDLDERAHRYALSATERGLWERISELRWLLADD